MIAVPGGFDGSGDLIRIANLDDLRGEVDINEADFRGVHMNQQTEVIPDAYTDRIYPARVVKIYPRVNRQKGTIKVEVKLDQVDEYLKPDMSVRINFLADAPQNEETLRVFVPKVAVQSQGEQTFVWTVRDKQLRRLDTFMPEPQGDGGDIDPRLEQMHGRGMPNHMWRNVFGRQTRASGHGALNGVF